MNLPGFGGIGNPRTRKRRPCWNLESASAGRAEHLWPRPCAGPPRLYVSQRRWPGQAGHDAQQGRSIMDAAALRALQAPLKERYRNDPRAGTITLKAKGTLDDAHIACRVETGRGLAVAGLHPATGGSGLELCSGDILLEALVACAGVTLKAVATALDV